jgi:hypothetical protein
VAMVIGAESGAATGPIPAEARRQEGLRLERPGESLIDVLYRPSESLIEASTSVQRSSNAIYNQLLGDRDDHRQLLKWSTSRRCCHPFAGLVEWSRQPSKRGSVLASNHC